LVNIGDDEVSIELFWPLFLFWQIIH